MIITLSSSAIRAEVRSLIALKASLATVPAHVLSPDRDMALNRQLVFHFSAALMRIAPVVTDYVISPADYYDRPEEELMMQAELGSVPGNVSATVVRMMLENYIADMTLASLLADTAPRQAAIHEASGRTMLARLAETLLAPPAPRRLRIRRTI